VYKNKHGFILKFTKHYEELARDVHKKFNCFLPILEVENKCDSNLFDSDSNFFRYVEINFLIIKCIELLYHYLSPCSLLYIKFFNDIINFQFFNFRNKLI